VPEVLRPLKGRFQLRWLVFVGARGMASDRNLEALQEACHDWIVGGRLQSRPRLADALLPSWPLRSVAENLEVKEAWGEGIRYVVCRVPGKPTGTPPVGGGAGSAPDVARTERSEGTRHPA
jgi:hypothetical protein